MKTVTIKLNHKQLRDIVSALSACERQLTSLKHNSSDEVLSILESETGRLRDLASYLDSKTFSIMRGAIRTVRA